MKRSETHVGMMVEILNPNHHSIICRTKAGRAIVVIVERCDFYCYVEICKEKYGKLMSTGYERKILYKDLKIYKETQGTQWWT